MPSGGTVANGLMVDATARFTGGMFECIVTPPQTSVKSTFSASTTPGMVELIVQDATIAFDHVFVVEQGS
jgi:hypothetical protein